MPWHWAIEETKWQLQVFLENIRAQRMDQIIWNIGEAIAANQVTNAAQHTDNHQEKGNNQPGAVDHQIAQKGICQSGSNSCCRQGFCRYITWGTGQVAHRIGDKTEQINKGHLG